MPIGKNAIKRVANNGYSKVETSAPDMENSTVAEEKDAIVKEKLTPPTPAPVKAAPKAKKKTTKKQAPTPKKSMESEPELSPIKTLDRVTGTQSRQGDGYINIGGELPIYLL